MADGSDSADRPALVRGMDEKKLERALYEALSQFGSAAFIGEFEADSEITIDGAFNLRRVARRLLRQN